MDHDCARLINGPVAYVWAAFTVLLFQAGPPAIIFRVADAGENLLGQPASSSHFLVDLRSIIEVRKRQLSGFTRDGSIYRHVFLSPPLVTKALATKSYLGKYADESYDTKFNSD